MAKMRSTFLVLILLVGINLAEEFKVNNVDEFNSTLKKIKPGDVIYLAEGEWKDCRLLFAAMGNKENPIYLKAETPGKVLFTGNSSLRIAGNYLVVNGLYFKNGYTEKGDVIEFRKDSKSVSNYCRLTNTAIIDYCPSGDKSANKWVSLYGSHNRVDHCYFKNKSNEGCLLVVWLSDKPNYHLIDSNYFAYRPDLGRNGAEIIRAGTSDWSMYPSHTIIEHNLFEQCNGEREIISNKSCCNIYRYNTFIECKGTLTLRHGNHAEVYGNYFFGNNVKGTGGIRIIGEGQKVYNNYLQDLEGEDAFSAISIMNGVPDSPPNRYFQVKNALVAFNTLINNRHSIEIGVGKDAELNLPPINSVIANNIVYSTKGALIKYIDIPKNFKWEGNLVYGSDLGITNPGGISIADPKFQINEFIYRPQAIELVKDKAVGVYEFVTENIDGQKRSNIKSIGCDEISNSEMIRKPMNKYNTGPKWLKLNMESKE